MLFLYIYIFFSNEVVPSSVLLVSYYLLFSVVLFFIFQFYFFFVFWLRQLEEFELILHELCIFYVHAYMVEESDRLSGIAVD